VSVESHKSVGFWAAITFCVSAATIYLSYKFC